MLDFSHIDHFLEKIHSRAANKQIQLKSLRGTFPSSLQHLKSISKEFFYHLLEFDLFGYLILKSECPRSLETRLFTAYKKCNN